MVYSPAERADTLPLFFLCPYMYSMVGTIVAFGINFHDHRYCPGHYSAAVWSLDRVSERFSELVCNLIEACKNFHFDHQTNLNRLSVHITKVNYLV